MRTTIGPSSMMTPPPAPRWGALAIMIAAGTSLFAADAPEKTEEKRNDKNPCAEVGDFTAGEGQGAKGVPQRNPWEVHPPRELPAGVEAKDLERNQIERRFAVPDLLDPTPVHDRENHHALQRNREPSACGNKEDVRRLWLLEGEGRGLQVAAADMLCATALHHATRQLDDAWRLDGLEPLKETVLSLDYGQQGLGNGCCGPPITLEKYQLKQLTHHDVNFTLQPAN